MSKRASGLLLIALFTLAFAAAPVAAHQKLYATEGNGGTTKLYILNPATGSILQTVGDTGEWITGLDFHPLTGELYGTTTPDSAHPSCLVKINPTTAQTTVVGPHGIDLAIVDLTFSPSGTLYGWLEPFYDDLVTLNLTTGAATVVGDYGYSTRGAALDMAPDGKLWFFGENWGDGEIVQLDPATGLRKGVPFPLVDNDGFFWNAGSHDALGTLYALRFPSRGPGGPRYLVTLDTDTGVFTTIGEIPLASPSGLAWSTEMKVPTLSTWGALALCLFLSGSAVLMMRKRMAG
jgi:DNA-binding beta-propeller fold protein YncE